MQECIYLGYAGKTFPNVIFENQQKIYDFFYLDYKTNEDKQRMNSFFKHLPLGEKVCLSINKLETNQPSISAYQSPAIEKETKYFFIDGEDLNKRIEKFIFSGTLRTIGGKFEYRFIEIKIELINDKPVINGNSIDSPVYWNFGSDELTIDEQEYYNLYEYSERKKNCALKIHTKVVLNKNDYIFSVTKIVK